MESTGETPSSAKIADFHTYFVGCDEWGFSVWAHNADCHAHTFLEALGIADEATRAKILAARDTPGGIAAELGKHLKGDAAHLQAIETEVLRQAKLTGRDLAKIDGDVSLLTKLQGTHDPNPLAYSLAKDAHYGGTHGYPNIAGRDQQAKELAHAARNGVTPLEVPAEANATVQQALRNQHGGKQVKWVVTTEGDMYVIPYNAADGRELAHTVAAPGKDVMAAGTARVTADGKITDVTGLSGHFRPDEKLSKQIVNDILSLAGLR